MAALTTVTGYIPPVNGVVQSGSWSINPQVNKVTGSGGAVLMNGAATGNVTNGALEPIVVPKSDDNTVTPTNINYLVTVQCNTYQTQFQCTIPTSLGNSVLFSQLVPASNLPPSGNNSIPTVGQVKALIAAGGSLTGPLVTQVPNIVFDGDSLTLGYGSLPYNDFPFGQDYPSQVTANLDPRGTYFNVGVGGEQITTMLANAATVVDTKLVSGANNIVVICGGSNDIWVSDVNPYATIVSYCQARRAAGWRVVVCTIGPRSDTGIPADFDTKRLACNTSIRTNWATFADALADFGADSSIGVTGASADARYYAGDGAHLNFNGYAIRAAIASAALNTLGVAAEPQKNKPAAVGDLWLPASQFYAVTGAPVYGLIPGTLVTGWKLSHGSAMQVATTTKFPDEWKTYGIYGVYTRTGSASGNYSLILGTAPFPVFSFTPPVPFPPVSAVVTSTTAAPFAPGTATYAQCPALGSASVSGNLLPRYTEVLMVERLGTDATNDTCTDDMYLMGLYLQRQS